MSRIERPLPGLLLLAALSVASLAGCGGDDSRSGAAASAGLLFVRDDAGGVPDLMHARISSGEVRALTSTASRAERRPLWVRGQQRILFESSRAAPRDPPRLVLLDPATGRESSLTPNLGWIERSAALAPDGRSVVYAFISPPEALPPAGLKRQGILSRHEEVLIEGPRETEPRLQRECIAFFEAHIP